MMRPRTLLATALAFLATAACSEQVTFDDLPMNAGRVHLKGGANAEPSFFDGGLALSGSGELAGLGNGDVLVTLNATANVAATCTNQGSHQAPGQNPAPISVTGSQAIPEGEVKNGTTPFSVATVPPDPVIPGARDCPNTNWTELIENLLFTSATITVEQPVGTVVLVVSCSFSPPTSDGAVPKQDVSCS